MDDRQTPWWDALGTGEPFTVKIGRGAMPPLPWMWKIVVTGRGADCRGAVKGYRTAEDAWAAGQAALAALQRRAQPRADGGATGKDGAVRPSFGLIEDGTAGNAATGLDVPNANASGAFHPHRTYDSNEADPAQVAIVNELSTRVTGRKVRP